MNISPSRSCLQVCPERPQALEALGIAVGAGNKAAIVPGGGPREAGVGTCPQQGGEDPDRIAVR
eukprot:5656809-Alexandrium_andersonii.AAC.1